MEYLLPVYKDGTIEDGAFLHVIEFCKNCSKNKECRDFYQKISPEHYNRFLTCPHGMSVYCSYSNGKMLCFTCMRGKGSYKKDKAKGVNKPNSQNIVFNPVLAHDQLLDLIMYSMRVEEADAVLEEKRASIDSISHEVKKLNAQIKDRSDDIIQTYADGKVDYLSREELYSLIEKIKTVYVCSSMVNTRFSLLDYERNPQILSQGPVYECNIYGKFDKIRMIFSNYLGRRVPIYLKGSTYRRFWAYPMFEMIPLLLVDNAVKYSSNGNSVEISFNEEGSDLYVDISSYSPYCSQFDIENIFTKGFRGKNAVKVADGSGIGLFFVKLLCDLHKIGIAITSDSTRVTEISGVAYAPFNVKLKFSDTF